MTDDQLRECVTQARCIAESVGTMHAYWDIIFDAEAILAGKRSLLNRQTIEYQFREIFPERFSQ